MNEFSLISNDELMVYSQSQDTISYFYESLWDERKYLKHYDASAVDSSDSIYVINQYIDITFKQPVSYFYDSSVVPHGGIDINSSINPTTDASVYPIVNPYGIKRENGLLSVTPGYGEIIITAKGNAIIEEVELHKVSGPDWKASRWVVYNSDMTEEFNEGHQYSSNVDTISIDSTRYGNLENINISFAPVIENETYTFDYIKVNYISEFEGNENYLRFDDANFVYFDDGEYISYN